MAHRGKDGNHFERTDGLNDFEFIMENIANPRSTSIVINYTGELCENILAKCGFGNRKLRQNQIAKLTRSFEKGRMRLTSATISYDDHGDIFDGRHRIWVGKLTGISFECHTLFGIPTKNFAAEGEVAPRDKTDMLQLTGYKHPMAIRRGRFISWAERLTVIPYSRNVVLDNVDILELSAGKYQNCDASLKWGQVIKSKRLYPDGLVSALHYLFSLAGGAAAADDFMEALRSYAPTSRRQGWQPIHMMHKQVEEYRKQMGTRINDDFRAAMMIKAWNFYRAGQLRVTKEESQWFPGEPFPRIVGL